MSIEERLDHHGEPATRVIDEEGKFIGIYADDCAYCSAEKEAGNSFFPRHWASSRCESGKRSHCTCDCCW